MKYPYNIIKTLVAGFPLAHPLGGFGAGRSPTPLRARARADTLPRLSYPDLFVRIGAPLLPRARYSSLSNPAGCSLAP